MTDGAAPALLDFGVARKRNLFAQVVGELGARIVSGAIGPDDAFPKEADLEAQLGVSRSVIREAVKALAAKGLIESRTRVGIRVRQPVHWNLLDADVLSWRYGSMPPQRFLAELFEVRLMIEPQAAELAAERARQSDIEEIAAAYAAMVEANVANVSGVEADLRFHRGILAACANALLLQMGNPIGVGLTISHRFSNEAFAIFLPKHGEVLDGIRHRDPDAARRAMHELLSETREYFRGHLPK